MAAAPPPSSAETAALLPVFVPSEAPEMTPPTVEPPSLPSDRRVRRYVRGAAAKVPAWTFGEDWAREHFRGKWRQHKVSGTFVRMLEPEWGLFVWDDPGDAPSELRTLLKHVVWQDDDADDESCYFDFKDIHAVHHANQALFLLGADVERELARGVDRLGNDLVRVVLLHVQSPEELDLVFGSARSALRSRPRSRSPGTS